MGRGGYKAIAGGALLLAFLLAPVTGGSAESLSRPAAGSVAAAIDSTPTKRSIRSPKGIEVHAGAEAARADPTVVYSVRLRDLNSGERVRLSGTVAPSYCAGSDINGAEREVSPCRVLAHDHVPNPHYPIRLEARLYKATSGSDPGRQQDQPLAVARNICTLARHHCPLTLESDTALRGVSKRFVNLELTAWTRSSDRHEPDRLDLDCFAVTKRCESNPTNSTDPSDSDARIHEHGQLGVVRFGARYPGAAGPDPLSATSTRIDGDAVEVNPPAPHEGDVIQSTRIKGLSAGDLLEVSGAAELSGDGFDHLAASYWVLARDPGSTTAAAGTPDRYLSGFNGVNCLGATGALTSTTSGYCSPFRDPPTLPVQQVGLGKVPRTAPSTMYLNYVILASDHSFPPGATPVAHVDSVTTEIACDPLPRAGPKPGCSIDTP